MTEDEILLKGLGDCGACRPRTPPANKHEVSSASSGEESSSSEDAIEAPKAGGVRGRHAPQSARKPVYKNKKPPEIDGRRKENRERTPAQTAAWNRALEVRNQNRNLRKEEENRIAEQKNEVKKQLEEKIVRKAISIKKRQIKAEMVLDEVSDDETPIEEIRAKYGAARHRQSQSKPPAIKVQYAPPPPQYVFI